MALALTHTHGRVQGGPSAHLPHPPHPPRFVWKVAKWNLASRGKLHSTVGTPTGGMGAGGYNFPREARFHFATFHAKRGGRDGRGTEGPPCTPPVCVCVCVCVSASAIGMTDFLNSPQL